MKIKNKMWFLKAVSVFVFNSILLSFFNGIAQIDPSNPESRLEIFSIDDGERTLVYKNAARFEAPNWSRDGKYLLFNMSGQIYTIPIEGGEPKLVNTEFADRCNNDHGISPDGKQLVISHNDPDAGSLIYTLPIEGGEPRLITTKGPSYWHGWSPDGKILAYCAERNGEYDIYTISVNGGEEKRLTFTTGLDDGPDYSIDGRYIYFNSVRTGIMQIWRMMVDGSQPEQLTFDSNNDWFPHPSPDGKWIVYISYIDPVDPGSHPPDKNVMLRIMPADGGKPQELIRFTGGQGTINVPSWSPDSKSFAFVSYGKVN